MPSVPDLSDTVTRLKAELVAKEAKITSLSRAIQKLKAQLLSISNELAESKMKEMSKIHLNEDIFNQKITPLTSKISQLELKSKRQLKLIRLSETTEKLKSDKVDLEQDMQRLTGELGIFDIYQSIKTRNSPKNQKS